MVIYPKTFIVGYPRSGTTWMRKLLALHPDVLAVRGESFAYKQVYCLYERVNWAKALSLKSRLKRYQLIFQNYGLRALLFGVQDQHFLKSAQELYRFTKTNSVNGMTGIHMLIDESILVELIQDINRSNINDFEKPRILIEKMFDAFYNKHCNSRDKMLAEKTPDHALYLEDILKDFPESKAIEMIRDGRDVAASLKARANNEQWAQERLEIVIHEWKTYIQRLRKIKQESRFSERIYTVRYEDLRENTAQILQEILLFLELKADEELILELVRKTDIQNIPNKGKGKHIYSGNVGSWINELADEDIMRWHTEAGELLKNLGYTL